jgi:hypothetical protein
MTAAKAGPHLRQGAALAGLALGGALAQGHPAFADILVSVRSGDHPGFGRAVVDTPTDPPYRIEQTGNRVVVRLLQPLTLDRAPAAPHNVDLVRTMGSTLELTIQPGTTVHPSVIGGHLVLDVNDPKPAADVSAAADPPESKK